MSDFQAVMNRLNEHYQSRTYHIQAKLPLAEELVMCAREVLWKLDGDRELGQEPGSFNASLIETLCLADPTNRQRLFLSMPAMATVVTVYKEQEHGIEILRVIARGADNFPEQPAPGTPKGN